MSLYRVTSDKLESVPRTTFAAESLLERKDLQRLLRRDLSVLGEDLLVVAEEYGEWEESNRRIDLLCLGKDANLVVIEIKRTEDGGHMELQAIRYAAMVSSMTLDQVIQAHAQTNGLAPDASRSEVLDFLEPTSEENAELGGGVRIILVSADFSTELTTAVLWLNRQELDITCIRLRPYRLGVDIFVDATQIIPLPETADYEVKVKAQEKEKRKVLGARHEIFRRFWTQFIERSKTRTSLFSNKTTCTDAWISAGIGRSGFTLNTVLTQNESHVECYIRLHGDEEKSKAAFSSLLSKKDEIEARFGSELDWQNLPGKKGCRICKELTGGWKSGEAEWPALQDGLLDSLIRLESALKKPISDLRI